MSVRIYQLSKQLEMENKDLLVLLKERGYEAKSASSTISNIDADALVAEFKPEGKKDPEEGATGEAKKEEEPAPKKREEIKLPAGRFVKTAEDIKIEKAEKAEKAEKEKKTIIAPARKQAAPPPPPPPPAQPSKPSQPPQPSVAKPSQPPQPPVAKASQPPQPPVAQPPPPPPTITPVTSAQPETEEGEAKTEKTGVIRGDRNNPTVVTIKPPIVVRDFAATIGLKPFRLISELMEMGIFASMNQGIEKEAAAKVAEKHGFLLEVKHRGESQPEVVKKEAPKPVIDESKLLKPRPPVVCVLGHVDHGKTTLLDTIRNANVVAGEAGGITQHVGAYQITHKDHKITFIDTPGHAAFSKMRERGANVTDIAVLVVAADDGFMPQTDEALKFAQNANVPVVVAINKLDAKGANVDRVKQQMQERDIAPEDWGGETLTTPLSALKNENVDKLLESILLQTEILELKANPKCPAEGIIVEAQIEVGRGSTATAIIQKGNLKAGASLICGHTYCKVRAIMDDKGQKIKSAGPSTPVTLMGWSDTPESGSCFTTVKNERVAKSAAAEFSHERKLQSASDSAPKPVDFDKLMEVIADSQQKVYSVILKGDVHGTVEALSTCLKDGIVSDKIKLEVIHSDVGLISKSDIERATTSEATIVAFNVKMDQGVQALAKQNNTKVIQHNIIYEIITQVKEAMGEMLDPELHENKLGAAEVRQVFPIANGFIAGCMVTEGRINRDAFVRVNRKNEIVYNGKISILKRFQDDANEVRSGYECGIRIQGFNTYEQGDTLECYEVKKVQPKL